jgi:fermentation-respiration switch protein FrsA (DUF1100 family)
LFAAIVLVYLLVVGAIWYTQSKFLFHPDKTVDVTPGDLGVKFENVTLPLAGDQLAGWWVPAEDPQAKTLLYLHGNAANVSANARHVVRLHSTGLNIFIIDYRGYGNSTGGPPREKLVYEDAERAWKYLVGERHIPPASIAIYGHSLGGAVGIDLASKHPEAGALIVEGTLTSIADRADGTLYGEFLPVRLILTERFDSISKIGSIHLPKLILQGDADTMALPVMARRLYAAATDPKQLSLIPGGGHEDSAVVNPNAYFAALNGFLMQYNLKPAR